MRSKARWPTVVILAVSALWLSACSSGTSVTPTLPVTGNLASQKFAAHYVDSAPVHGRTFALVPDKVLINFDFSLAEPSTITVTKDGNALRIGASTISGPNALQLSSTLPGDGGDGLYVVKYVACWPDRSCHDGQFAFNVDGRTRSAYTDMTGRGEVVIDMQELKFQPARIVVSKGTKVTWNNREVSVHFVNSDPHPSHNNLVGLNSFDLKEGEPYSYTFDQVGEWAYHCSAHVPQGMVGSVIVR